MKQILKDLGPPRPIKFDKNLELQADNKRYHLCDYSDAHWIYQLVACYKSHCKSSECGDKISNICAAAEEKILRCFISSGIVQAKKLANELDKYISVSWIDLNRDNASWQETRMRILADRKIKKIDGD